MAKNISRRDFLKQAWGMLALLAGLGGGYMGLSFLASRKAPAETVAGIVSAGKLDDFPLGSVTPFHEQRFYLVRFTDGGLLALSQRCTHLECVVLWNETSRRFNCPCHGSEFQMDGTVLNLPAPRPLVRFPVMLQDNVVQVDTGTPIERDTTDAADIVYPQQG